MSDIEDFEVAESNSSLFEHVAAGSIKKGGLCMLKGFPCKVIEFTTAKPGKHGSAKASIVGIDIFTNKKYEDSYQTSATVQVPVIKKVEYEVADVNDDDDFVSAIIEDGTLKADLKLGREDDETYHNLWKMWLERGERLVFFTLLAAVGKEKYISGRYKD